MLVKISRYIFLLYFLSPSFILGMNEFVPTMTSCEQTEFLRLASVNNGDLVDEFKIGCKNSTALSDVINAQLQIIATDPQGAGMLRIMAAMINPYVKCANSLEALINSIPTDRVISPQDKINKAKRVSYLYRLLDVHNRDFLDVINPANSRALFQSLVGNPIIFPNMIPENILTEDTFTNDPALLVTHINRFWNVAVADSAKSVLPFLRKKMFSMEIGPRSEYSYNIAVHSYVIRLNPTAISAYCVIGTPLVTHVGAGTVPIVHSYAAEKKDFEADIGLLHEMNHHFIVRLTSDFRESFDDIIPLLRDKKVDISYILKLSEVYTGFSEFQNITGITVVGGQIYFNKYSEGAYVLGKKGLSIRCSHTDKRFFNVPVGIVELIKEAAAFVVGVGVAPDSPPKSEGFIGWNGF